MIQKRVAAIHDISCFGKCSLTVALPLISATGIEVAAIPTAVLSTHTGGFTGYTFRDFTDDILPVARHWQSAGISVDAVYTGYLGSKEQVSIVIEAIKLIKKEKAPVIVDPVMADHGRLYGGFPDDFPMEMKKLCRHADIITPNITEAAFMLGREYKEGPYDKAYIEDLLKGLSEITHSKIVLTGVWFDNRRIGAACFDGEKTDYIFSERIETTYHGTGDVFASTLVAAYMNGLDLKGATRVAVDFTCACINRTWRDHKEMKYSVNFEAEIPNLIRMIKP